MGSRWNRNTEGPQPPDDSFKAPHQRSASWYCRWYYLMRRTASCPFRPVFHLSSDFLKSRFSSVVLPTCICLSVYLSHLPQFSLLAFLSMPLISVPSSKKDQPRCSASSPLTCLFQSLSPSSSFRLACPIQPPTIDFMRLFFTPSVVQPPLLLLASFSTPSLLAFSSYFGVQVLKEKIQFVRPMQKLQLHKHTPRRHTQVDW